MAIISGTNGNDSILPGGVSAGVTGGVPSSAQDTFVGSLGSDTVDGGASGGSNTLDYRAFTTAITATYTGAGLGNVVKSVGGIDSFSNIRSVWGGSGNDVLTGSGVAWTFSLWLRGNEGNDTIDGVSSRSVAADYAGSPAAISANIGLNTVADGTGGTDTLINVRRVHGSNFNDTLVGGTFGDVFQFGLIGGSKTIDGGGASDRGNELRYAINTPILVDVIAGTVLKSNGLTDSFVNVTRFVGGAGNDTLVGTAGADTLEGEAGNDLIIGRSGFDWVGYGTQTFDFYSSGAVVDLGLGTATDGWGGSDTLIDISGVFGGNLNDDLKGRDLGFATRSQLQGAGGSDTLRGASGGFTAADYFSEAAAVTVNLATGLATDGTGATDTLIGINSARGSAFNDSITGATGDDWVTGGVGNDTVGGGNGNDRVLGDDGNDSLDGGAGLDVITGGLGQDNITGGTESDRFNFTITATPGEHSSRTTQDTITDFSVAEGDYFRLTSTIAGSPDIYYAGQVATAYATLSADIPLPAWAAPAGITAPLPVFWIPHTTTGGWVVVDENSNGTLEATEFAVRLASATANSGLRVSGSSIVTPGLIGDGTSNTILITEGVAGGARGLGGDDVIYGGGSFDNMAGGLGNDQFVVRNKETTLIELAGEGTADTAYFLVSDCTNGANIEIGRLYDTANLLRGSATDEQLVANAGFASTLYGNGGNDILWSTALADTLDGGDGDDVIRGQGGNDIMYGGLGNDQFVMFGSAGQVVEYLNGGYDIVYVLAPSFTMGANIEEGRLSGTGAVTLIGSDTNESLVANPGEASTLEGRGGNDVLYGGSGAALQDTLRGGTGDDILYSQGGPDVLVGGTGNDQYVALLNSVTFVENAGEGYDFLYFAGAGSITFSASFEQVLLSGSATGLTYTGVALDKLVAGNSSGLASNINAGAGNDLIYGTAAGDTIIGGLGDDTIYCGGGADRLYYGITGFGNDLVSGFDQVGGAKLQFFAGSGVTSFAQVSLTVGGGNTGVVTSAGTILVFGVTLTQTDFLFG